MATQEINLFEIPKDFEAEEKLLHFSLQMKLKDKKGHQFGKITEKTENDRSKFVLLNENGNIYAVAHKFIKLPESRFDINDAADHKLGSIDHQLTKTQFGFRNTIVIYDSEDKQLGKAQQIDIDNQTVLMKGINGAEVGEIKRSDSVLGDTWNCRFLGGLQTRVTVFLPAFLFVLLQEKKKLLK